MAKARRRKARRSKKRGVEGLDFVKALGGEVFTCKAYKKGPKGKIRCAAFTARSGKPSPKVRKKAGIKSKYRYNAKKASKWRKKRGTARKVFGTRSSGVNGLGRVKRTRRRRKR